MYVGFLGEECSGVVDNVQAVQGYGEALWLLAARSESAPYHMARSLGTVNNAGVQPTWY